MFTNDWSVKQTETIFKPGVGVTLKMWSRNPVTWSVFVRGEGGTGVALLQQSLWCLNPLIAFFFFFITLSALGFQSKTNHFYYTINYCLIACVLILGSLPRQVTLHHTMAAL